MSEWGVGDVARWLEDADMEGTAAIFKAEGVSGKDVLAFVSAERRAPCPLGLGGWGGDVCMRRRGRAVLPRLPNWKL